MNKKSYLEIFILISVSFSPLIPQSLKAFIVLFLIVINHHYLLKIDKKKGILLFVFISIFIVNFLFDLRNIQKISEISIINVYIPMCIILGFIVSSKYLLADLYFKLDKVIYIISIFSLFGVFIYTFIPGIINYFPAYNYYNTTHKTAFIFNILTNSSTGILTRNAGIAWEPGAFQFIVNLGLYAYLKQNKSINLFKVSVYSLAIITTQSTAGILIFILITFKLFMMDKKARVLIILMISLFSSLVIKELTYQYQYKLFGSYAFETRLDPLSNAFQMGKKYTFGIGNSGFDIYYRNNYQVPWDSFGQIFIRYGYPLTLTLIYCLVSLFKNEKILVLILLITFSSQNIWFFPLIASFYFINLNATSNNKNKIKELKSAI